MNLGPGIGEPGQARLPGAMAALVSVPAEPTEVTVSTGCFEPVCRMNQSDAVRPQKRAGRVSSGPYEVHRS